MITTFFKMTKQPFPETIPAIDIMQEERMTQGIARLTFMIQYGFIALITGDEGVGKSSLIKLFINSLDKKQYYPVYQHITNLKSLSFLKILVSAMDEMPTLGKENAFHNIINKVNQKDITTIIIIDEANLLSTDALIDLRLLVSSAMDDVGRLKIILSGNNDLKKELKRSCHIALRQRIKVIYNILPLTQTQTHHYIDFHMRRVGAIEKIFDDDVKTSIHEYSWNS